MALLRNTPPPLVKHENPIIDDEDDIEEIGVKKTM